MSPLEEQFTSLSKTVSYPATSFTNKSLLFYTIFRCLKTIGSNHEDDFCHCWPSNRWQVPEPQAAIRIRIRFDLTLLSNMKLAKLKLFCTALKTIYFPFMYIQKRFNQASYVQNGIKMFSLELCYSVKKYSTADAAIQLSA